MADIWDVDDWVEQAAALPIRSFYPSAVANATSMPLEQVFNRLIYLSQGNSIHLKYEIRCPEYDCARTVKTIDKVSEDLFEQKCTIHGEFDISPDIMFPVFEFDPEYKRRMRAKKKLKNRHIRLRGLPAF